MDADWYVDPLGRFDGRFFDGVQWTGQVSDDGQLRSDPEWQLNVGAAVAEQPAMWIETQKTAGVERRAGERREANTEVRVDRRTGQRRQMRVVVTDINSVGGGRPWRRSK